MDEITIFFTIFISVLGAFLMLFKRRLDNQYHKDIPYMPKKYTNAITLAFGVQVIGSVVNLLVTPFPFSTAVIFVLLGISLTVTLVIGHKRSKIIEEHWRKLDSSVQLNDGEKNP